MTFIHAPTSAAPIFTPVVAPVVTNASAPLVNPFPDIRRWLTALLLLAAIFSIGSRAASADIEIVLPGHSYADASIKAPVEAGIIAAKSGRLQDAITILTPHANMGHTTANYILGLIYLQDRGALVARPALSHRHFARAAATGHVASMFEAAFQFERGIGTGRDMNRAVRLYQIAARANHLNAQFNLAVLLSHAQAKREDLQQAYFWAIAARNKAFRTGDNQLRESNITRLVIGIRSRIPHAAAAKASTAAARLTGQPV